MKIHTTRFGILDIPEDRVITLPDGILGLPEARRYILLEHDSEGTPFKWLQALDNPDLAFIVIDPQLVVSEYQVEFDDETARNLGVIEEARQEFVTMSIVNIPQDEPISMTVNLRAPIVVHLEKRIGRQIILPNEDYPIKHRLFPEGGPSEKTGA